MTKRKNTQTKKITSKKSAPKTRKAAPKSKARPKPKARPKNSPKVKQAPKKLFRASSDENRKFERVTTVRAGESLRFKTPDGKYTKFDARKNLIIEIWQGKTKKNQTLNKVTRSGDLIPQKFNAKNIKKKQVFLAGKRAGVKLTSDTKSFKVRINRNMTIADNLAAKVPELSDLIRNYSLKGNPSTLTLSFSINYKREGAEKPEQINEAGEFLTRETSKQVIENEIAQWAAYRLYRNALRASTLKQGSGSGAGCDMINSFTLNISVTEMNKI